jgi:hypothetical protein
MTVMKQKIVTDTRPAFLNTDNDVCLYWAPRPSFDGSEAHVRGRDLYLHRRKSGKTLYYYHLWTKKTDEVEKIIPVSSRLAERYLASRGIICQDLPGAKAALTLMQQGYGIPEEF